MERSEKGLWKSDRRVYVQKWREFWSLWPRAQLPEMCPWDLGWDSTSGPYQPHSEPETFQSLPHDQWFSDHTGKQRSVCKQIGVQGIRRLIGTAGWGRGLGARDEVEKALWFYRSSIHARKSGICLQIKSAQGSVTTDIHNRLNLTKECLIEKESQS